MKIKEVEVYNLNCNKIEPITITSSLGLCLDDYLNILDIVEFENRLYTVIEVNYQDITLKPFALFEIKERKKGDIC
jgi:hypothetical protein